MKTSLIGIPLDLGGESLGVNRGPDAFRKHGLIQKLQTSGFTIEDKGNIDVLPRKKLKEGSQKLKYLSEILRISEKSANLVYTCLQKGSKVIALGGDHSINLGVMSGASAFYGGDIGLLYLDAHGDMNTDKTTPTGNIHGMHVASLMGFGDERLINVYKKGRKLKPRNLLHIAGCDFDQAELDLMEKEGIKNFKIVDILSYGLAPLFKQIRQFSKQLGHVWVSLDLDSIDYMYAPGAGMPNKGGLTYREVTTIADFIGKHCNVVGVDVVEYNPLQDRDRKTAELGIELVAKLLGKNYSWYSNYLTQNKIR